MLRFWQHIGPCDMSCSCLCLPRLRCSPLAEAHLRGNDWELARSESNGTGRNSLPGNTPLDMVWASVYKISLSDILLADTTAEAIREVPSHLCTEYRLRAKITTIGTANQEPSNRQKRRKFGHGKTDQHANKRTGNKYSIGMVEWENPMPILQCRYLYTGQASTGV